MSQEQLRNNHTMVDVNGSHQRQAYHSASGPGRHRPRPGTSESQDSERQRSPDRVTGITWTPPVAASAGPGQCPGQARPGPDESAGKAPDKELSPRSERAGEAPDKEDHIPQQHVSGWSYTSSSGKGLTGLRREGDPTRTRARTRHIILQDGK